MRITTKNALLLLTIASLSLAGCKKSPEQKIEQFEKKKAKLQKKIDKLGGFDIFATDSLDKVIAYQKEQFQKKTEIEANLKKIEERIADLDTTVKKLPLVTALQLQDSLFQHFVEVQGSVKTKDDVMVYPEFSGVMTNLYVREGQYIKRGALVARVDDGGMNQQIAQQQVQLDLARTTFERQKRLWDQNIGSEIQYLQAKSNVESLEKSIEAMQRQLGKVNVYAPFSGVVEEVITKQGQVVSPGATPLFRLVNLGSVYVEAEVPEIYLPKIKRGTKVEVEFEALERQYNSSVRRVNNTINPNSRSFIIEVNVPNRDRLVKPNLIANLKLNDYTNKEAILIPSSLILENANGDSYVFVADSLNQEKETLVKRTNLQLGETTEDGRVEVLEGLQAGQLIIEEGAKNLEDGDEVRVYSN